MVLKTELIKIKRDYNLRKVGKIETSTEDMMKHRQVDTCFRKLRKAGISVNKSNLSSRSDPRVSYDRQYFVKKMTNENYFHLIEDGPGVFGVAYDYYFLIGKERIPLMELVKIGNRIVESYHT